MRLLLVLALMGAFILGCEGDPSAPIAATPAYPEVAARGTFIQFESYGGDCAACISLIYSDESELLHRRLFYVNYDAGMGFTSDHHDAVTILEPLYPGNRIVITRTGDSAYVISKEE